MQNEWKMNEQERQKLMYHPILRYTTKPIVSREHIPEELLSNDMVVILENIASDAWLEINDFIARMDALIASIESRYMGSSVPTVSLSSAEIRYLNDIYTPGRNNYILPDLTNGLTFDMYRDALYYAPDIVRDVIINLWEAYHQQAYGITELETYRILWDVREEWGHNKYFFQSCIFPLIDRNLPNDLEPGSSGFNDISDLEKSQIADLIALTNERNALERELTDIITGRIQDENLAAKEERYKELTTSCKALQDKVTMKAEVVNSMCHRVDTSCPIVDCCETISGLSILTAFDNLVDAITEIIRVFDEENIRASILCLEELLNSCCNKIGCCNEQASNCNNHDANIQACNDLKSCCEIRSLMLRRLAYKLRVLNAETDDIVHMLNKISDGLVELEQKYKSCLTTFCQIDEIDKELKGDICSQVIDKFLIKCYIIVLTALLNFAVDVGRMPTQGDIDSIVQQILSICG
jgi:hypothetical protein